MKAWKAITSIFWVVMAMRNLIRSGLMYLIRFPLFYLAVLCTMVYSVLISALTPHCSLIDGVPIPVIGMTAYMVMPVFFFASAAFVALFLGTKQQYRMLGYPLIAGHTRIQVYLAELIVCTFGNLCILLPALFASILTNLLQAGINMLPVGVLLFYFVSGISIAVAMTSLWVLCGLLLPRASINIVVTLLLTLALFLLSLTVYVRLSQPAFYPDYSLAAPDMTLAEIDKLPQLSNPQYVGGFLRTLLSLFQILSPIGQGVEHMYILNSSKSVPIHGEWLFFSALFTLVTIYSGMEKFRKMDLR